MNIHSSFSDFIALLEAERPRIASQFAENLLLIAPFQQHPSQEERVALADTQVAIYIDHLHAPEAIHAQARRLVEDPRLHQVQAYEFVHVVAQDRAILLELGLQAITLGIVGAADGLRALMLLVDLSIAELMRHQDTDMRENRALLRGLIDHSPAGISVVDRQHKILLVNPVVAVMMGRPKEQITGHYQEEFFPIETVKEWEQGDRVVLEAGQILTSEDRAPLPDGEHVFNSIKFPLRNDAGEIYAVGNIITDITEQKKLEYERLLLQEQMIESQRLMLNELSTPLIPVADEVVVMPLIGSIDSARAMQIVETLLSGVTAHHAATVILDITGVPLVDTQVANVLVQAAQAVRLLGAQVILTGIRPEVAQTLVGLGVNLSGVITQRSLQAGIDFALKR
jgi:anti-anti-sigma factor